MNEDTIKGYCTKYALTQGIRECTVEKGQSGYCYTLRPDRVQLREGRDFFLDKAEAEKAAINLAMNRIRALKAQIKRLEPHTKTVKWAKIRK